MDALFGVAIAALFSGIHHVFGSVKVQLADILAILAVFLAVLKGITTPRISHMALVTLLLFLLYYLISALFVRPSMAVVKGVQFLLVFSFLFSVFGYYRTRSSNRLLIIVTILILTILVVSVGWYVAHGQFVGWKALNEPKTIFTLLPLVMVLVFNRFPLTWRPPWPLLAVCVCALVIFLSGERKAYLFALVALLIWAGPRKAWLYSLLPVIAIPIFWLAASADRTGYLHRQVTSLEASFSGQPVQDVSEAQLIDEHRPTTLSNAEREFTNRRAEAMWRRVPLLGIGTHAFEIQAEQDTSVPEAFRLGIHGEFYRALYENGLIGLMLYIAVWLVNFVCILTMWRATKEAGNPALNKIKLLCAAMILIYSAFESEKELMAYAICSLPFILGLVPRDPRLAYAGAANGRYFSRSDALWRTSYR